MGSRASSARSDESGGNALPTGSDSARKSPVSEESGARSAEETLAAKNSDQASGGGSAASVASPTGSKGALEPAPVSARSDASGSLSTPGPGASVAATWEDRMAAKRREMEEARRASVPAVVEAAPEAAGSSVSDD